MLSKEKKIRLEAKSRLKKDNNWLIAIIITATWIPYVLIDFLLKYKLDNLFTEILSIIIWIVLVMPLSLGIKRWYYKLAIGDSQSFSGIFYYFKNARLFTRAISAILIDLIIGLYYVLCMLPGTVLMLVAACGIVQNSNKINSDLSLYVALMAVAFILIIASLFLAYYLTLKYFLAKYFVVSDDYISIKDSLRFSAEATEENKFSIFKLELIYLSWSLLCVLILPIFYVFPYMEESLAVCAKWLIQKYRQDNPVQTCIEN